MDKKNQLNYIANSIPEFLKIIQEIHKSEEHCWYRGHKDARYLLTPNLYREDKLEACEPAEADVCSLNISRGSIPYKFKRKQKEAFQNFKKDGLAFVSHKPNNNFEWLVLMQHYGGDTQLLDWTTNPLISLYFALNDIQYDNNKSNSKNDFNLTMEDYIKEAVEKNEWINAYQLSNFDSSDYAVIYIINPLKINDNNLQIKNPKIILSSDDVYQNLLEPYLYFDQSRDRYPICVEAPKNDRRTYIQGSAFTLHGHYIDGLDWFTSGQDLVYKVYIPNEMGIQMKEDLKNIYNITHSFVFQDLSNVVKDS